jgi:hypothetical protein
MPLGCLNADVPAQELYLLALASGLVTQTSVRRPTSRVRTAGAMPGTEAQIVRRNVRQLA